MEKLNVGMPCVVMVDTDGTLISYKDEPREDVIALLKALHKVGCRIMTCSGGGVDYAAMWVRRLGLQDYVDKSVAKEHPDTFNARWGVDIMIDDENTSYGKTQIKV